MWNPADPNMIGLVMLYEGIDKCRFRVTAVSQDHKYYWGVRENGSKVEIFPSFLVKKLEDNHEI